MCKYATKFTLCVILHTVCKITHCVLNYTLCVKLFTVRSVWKKFLSQVMQVTNMRYGSIDSNLESISSCVLCLVCISINECVCVMTNDWEVGDGRSLGVPYSLVT